MKKLTRLIQALLLVVGSIIVLVIGWWLWQLLQEQEETEEAVRVPPQRPADVNFPLPAQPVEEEPEALVADESPDNLMDIDGIGPKYAQALGTLGILTFNQLSDQDPEALAEQLQASGVRVTADRIRQQDWIVQAVRLAELG